MSELPIVLLLFLVLAILLRMDIIFYIVYVLTGVYALSRHWAARSLAMLQVERRFTDHIFTGETATVQITVRNRSRLPVPWVRFDEAAPAEVSSEGTLMQAFALGPKDDITLAYELWGRQRGVYPIGPGQVSTGDLFGFGEAKGTAHEPRRLVVYPRVIPLAAAPLTSNAPYGVIRSRQPIFADPTRVAGVRDYQAGDPLHSVNWKTSARAGRLQVRKTEPAVSLTTLICLDLNAAAYSRHLRSAATEWAVVVAASLANYLVGQRQEVGVGSNGRDALTGRATWTIRPRPGRLHLMKSLEWLARVQPSESPAFAEWLPAATVDLPWGTTVIAVTATGDEATCRTLHGLRRAGLNPVLVAVEAHAHFGLIAERCRRLGITAFELADENALRRWQLPRTAAPAGVRP